MWGQFEPRVQDFQWLIRPALALAGKLARALGVTVEELSEELEQKRKARA